MSTCASRPCDSAHLDFYRESLKVLRQRGVSFLVGGAYAFERYTGLSRHTKDFDIFVRRHDARAALDAFAAEGYRVDLTFPHWLGKVYGDDCFIDIIFSSGNGVAQVDDLWFVHAERNQVLGVPVDLCPVEEMIWSKSFVMERERFDGADVLHLLRARGATLDWTRLLTRFGPYWRLLLSHVILFGFVYPSERGSLPDSVMKDLVGRLTRELDHPEDDARICRGTLLSREQYLPDVEAWGYQDARLIPRGSMTRRETADWTAAIDADRHTE